MPVIWESTLPEVKEALKEISEALPKWQNLNEQMLALRLNNFDAQVRISREMLTRLKLAHSLTHSITSFLSLFVFWFFFYFLLFFFSLLGQIPEPKGDN